MTIKKKLIYSNIFMVIFPTVFVPVVGLILYFIFYGINPNELHQDKSAHVNCFSVDDAKEEISNSDYEMVPGNVTVYRNSSNDYILAFENEEEMPYLRSHTVGIQRHAFIILIFAATILVFIINRYFVSRIYKSIVNPLDILADGTNEISRGNLEYRIVYEKKDEFSHVCTAFNEMAAKLSEMTLQQQREEHSRKALIAGISHDLRTPLTSIKAYVVGFENGIAKTPEKQKKYLATINQKTCELEYIINQLFLFSKLDVGDFPFNIETVNLGDELRQLVIDMKEEYENRGVKLAIEKIPTDVFCSIDVIQFGNVIQNIWSNTAKYKAKENAISTLTYEETDKEITISIYDDGPGVKEEALDKLFDIFYRTDDSRQNVALGSGLGLAISSKIISGFEGRIIARNQPDAGLCIDITLPKQGEEGI